MKRIDLWESVKLDKAVSSVAFSPDGKIISSGSFDGNVMLWDTATGKLINTMEHKYRSLVESTVFSFDGKILASGDRGRNIKIWDVTTGNCLIKIDGDNTFQSQYDLAFSPDSKILVSGDSMIKLWDPSTGKNINSFGEIIGSSRRIAYNPNGKSIASGYSNKVEIWEVPAGKLIANFESNGGSINTITYSPDGKIIATGGTSGGGINFFDSISGKLLLSLKDHAGTDYSISFSPDGKYLASGISSGHVVLWESSGKVVLWESFGNLFDKCRISEELVSSVAFSYDSKTMCAGSYDRKIFVWKIE